MQNDTFLRTYDEKRHFLRNIETRHIREGLLLEHEYLRGVSCLVTQDDNVLVEMRADAKEGGGLLDFCSGHVDNIELPAHAMIRELDEELGIGFDVAKKLTKLKEISLVIPRRKIEKNWHMTFYQLELPKNAKLHMQNSEIKSAAMISKNDVLNLYRANQKFLFPHDPSLLQLLSSLR